MKNPLKPPLLWAVALCGMLIVTLTSELRGQDTTQVPSRPDSLQSPEVDSLLLSPTDSLHASEGPSAADSSFTADFPLRKIENTAFNVGEHLTFVVRWGPISAGRAVMSIPEITWINGRPSYHIISLAESNPFFSTFFKVRDRLESFVDKEGIFSWRFEKHLREGKFRADYSVTFDQYRRKIITKSDTLDAPAFVQDILSIFYYIRTQPLEVGTSIQVMNFADGKIYPVEVKILRRETVKVRAGTFRCVVVEPVLKGRGVFGQKGKLKVWLTDDEKRIPVLMKSKAVFGSIIIELEKMEGV